MGLLSAPGPYFEQTWNITTRGCYIPKINYIGMVVSNKNTFFFISFLQYNYSGKSDLEETESTFNIGEQQPETRFYSVCSCEIMENARIIA